MYSIELSNKDVQTILDSLLFTGVHELDNNRELTDLYMDINRARSSVMNQHMEQQHREK